jgi:hypothetical protein
MLRATKALFAVAVATTLLLVLSILLHSNKVLAIPLGFMTFFDAETCPRGWSLYAAAQGRLIVSVDNPNNAGITVGVPLGDREDRTHSHRTSLTGDLRHQDIAGAGDPAKIGKEGENEECVENNKNKNNINNKNRDSYKNVELNLK